MLLLLGSPSFWPFFVWLAILCLDPLAACISNQMRDVLLAAIERLPERQGQIVRLYYFSGLTMKAIGAIRGLTESGICRVHADALSRLRAELEATGVEMPDRQSI